MLAHNQLKGSHNLTVRRGREANSLLALDIVCLVSLDANDATALKLPVVDHMVRLRRQHTLHVVLRIAEDYAEAVATTGPGLGWQWLDLKTLEYRNWESALDVGRVVEDRAVDRTVSTISEHLLNGSGSLDGTRPDGLTRERLR
jgi:hypothetical protein